MDHNVELAFILEIRNQCSYVLLAQQDLETAMKQGGSSRVWYSIQAALVSAANVSKILWPTKNASARGDYLRSLLGVEEAALIASRTFRNHFEHFDERLETWAASSKRQLLFDTNIAPVGMIEGVDPTDWLRNFDPVTRYLIYEGEVFDLPAVFREASELWGKAEAAYRKHVGL
jgi:hypothetical protein